MPKTLSHSNSFALCWLHEDQITAIRNGKAVAKIVESSTPNEVFVFGSIYVQSTPEKYLKLASDPEELRKLPNYLALRKFSDPPQLSDLEGFTLEADDIKQLKTASPDIVTFSCQPRQWTRSNSP